MEDPIDVASRIHSLEKASALIQTSISHLREIVEDRFDAHQRALDAAITASDKRMEQMSEWRSQYADQASAQRTKVEQLSTGLARLESDQRSIRDQVEARARPNPTIYIGGIGLLATLITGAWLVIGLQIDSRLGPLAVQNENSINDRLQLNAHVKGIEDTMRTRMTANDVSNNQRDLKISQILDHLERLELNKDRR